MVLPDHAFPRFMSSPALVWRFAKIERALFAVGHFGRKMDSHHENASTFETLDLC